MATILKVIKSHQIREEVEGGGTRCQLQVIIDHNFTIFRDSFGPVVSFYFTVFFSTQFFL